MLLSPVSSFEGVPSTDVARKVPPAAPASTVCHDTVQLSDYARMRSLQVKGDSVTQIAFQLNQDVVTVKNYLQQVKALDTIQAMNEQASRKNGAATGPLPLAAPRKILAATTTLRLTV